MHKHLCTRLQVCAGVLHPRVRAHTCVVDTLTQLPQPPSSPDLQLNEQHSPSRFVCLDTSSEAGEQSTPRTPTLGQKVSPPRRQTFFFFSLFVQRHPLHNILLMKNLTIARAANPREKGGGDGRSSFYFKL